MNNFINRMIYCTVLILLYPAMLSATVAGKDLDVAVKFDTMRHELSIVNTGDFEIRNIEIRFFPSTSSRSLFDMSKEYNITPVRYGPLNKGESVELNFMKLFNLSDENRCGIRRVLISGQYLLRWRTKSVELCETTD